jgi:hypothetical protein
MNRFPRRPGLSDPGTSFEPVSPSDTGDLPFVPRAIIVGAAGSLRVTQINGEIKTITYVPVGYNPIRMTRIWATGTTAIDITIVD